MKLTEEQSRLIENNHDLIYGYCHEKKLNIEEWYGDLAIALCEAAQKYIDTKSKFTTFAYICFDNKVKYILREKNFKKRKINLLEINALDSSDLDMLLYKTNNYGKLNYNYEDNYFSCDKINNDICELLIQDFTQKEIAKKLNITQTKVSRRLNKIRKMVESKMF